MASTTKKRSTVKPKTRTTQKAKAKVPRISSEAYKIDTQELLRKIDTSIRDALALDDITKTQISHDLHRHKRELEEHILKQESTAQNRKKHVVSHKKLQPTRSGPPELAGEIEIEEEIIETKPATKTKENVEITEKVSEKIVLSNKGEEVSRTYTKEDILVFDDKELGDSPPKKSSEIHKKQTTVEVKEDSKKKNKPTLSHRLKDEKAPIAHVEPLKKETSSTKSKKQEESSAKHKQKEDEIRAAFDNPANDSLETILAADAEETFGNVSEIANTRENPFLNKKDDSILNRLEKDGFQPENDESVAKVTRHLGENFHNLKKDEIRSAFDNPIDKKTEDAKYAEIVETFEKDERGKSQKVSDAKITKPETSDVEQLPETQAQAATEVADAQKVDQFIHQKPGTALPKVPEKTVTLKFETRITTNKTKVDDKTEVEKEPTTAAHKESFETKTTNKNLKPDIKVEKEKQPSATPPKDTFEKKATKTDSETSGNEHETTSPKKPDKDFETNDARIADLFDFGKSQKEVIKKAEAKTSSSVSHPDNTSAKSDVKKSPETAAEKKVDTVASPKQIGPVKNDVEKLPETKAQVVTEVAVAQKVDQFIHQKPETTLPKNSEKVLPEITKSRTYQTLPVNSFIETDHKVWSAVHNELERQRNQIELIASENYVSEEIMAVAGSVLTNKYAEGYPKARYYGGCNNVDVIEQAAIDRLKLLFKADHANVQPHSGSQANSAVYQALLKPGDTILGMSLKAGGHLTHGHKVNFSGQMYNSVQYGLDPKTELIDYKQVELLAKEHQPKLIIAGASSYSRIINFKRFGAIAKKVGALLLVDMAHIAGLVAGGAHPNPFPYADVVTSTTHKTLRGPRGGIILCKAHIAKKIDHALFPGSQGGPLQHIIAGKAICFKEAATKEFKHYVHRVVRNANVFAKEFKKLGAEIVSGGTDNHLFTINVKDAWDITGHEAEVLLESVGITLNKNAVPNDKLPPQTTSGVRIGTAAMTTRGFGPIEFRQVAKIITDLCQNPHDVEAKNFARKAVRELLQNFPLYTNRSY